MGEETERELDSAVRTATFAFLDQKLLEAGEETLPRRILQEGFRFRGRRVPLMGPQGIFKPAVLPRLPLTITTSPKGPYDDSLDGEGFLRYRYRGSDPQHHENVGLREAMKRQVPLVYLRGIVPGRYLPAYPAFIVGDEPRTLTFRVAIDERAIDFDEPILAGQSADLRRAYTTREVLQRIHQGRFRERVLQAYRECCAICRLKHRELLDASHILPDRHPEGEPTVSNGIALCKLHHAAYDRNILGIRPDLAIEVRTDVLEEVDGPMLLHGLKGFQGARLVIPARTEDRPNPDFLAERYEVFRQAS